MSELLSWHRVRQRVVCVDAPAVTDQTAFPLVPFPLIGKIYTILCVVTAGECALVVGPKSASSTILFELAEIRGDFCFGAKFFRPVRETSIENLRELLNPPPETKREIAEEAVHV